MRGCVDGLKPLSGDSRTDCSRVSRLPNSLSRNAHARQNCHARVLERAATMREIPKLQVLCLRSIGSHSCSAEDTFATGEAGEPSIASRLLRSFHQRPIDGGPNKKSAKNGDLSQAESSDDKIISSRETPDTFSTICEIPMKRTPCIGKGSARRNQANEIDLNHPIVGCRFRHGDPANRIGSGRLDDGTLIMEYGSVALDTLQSYIDSLVELGRMDDQRLGVHFFEEWKYNTLLGNGIDLAKQATTKDGVAETPPPTPAGRQKKRRRSSGSRSSTPVATATEETPSSPELSALGSLSLHNCTIFDETIEAMVKSRMGQYLGVLDLTGVNGLTDDLLSQLLPTCRSLVRLSVKNCRRLTPKSMEVIANHQTQLTFLDVGGSYNIHPHDLLDIVVPRLSQLVELHASGLAWTNELVSKLTAMRPWKGLSFGYAAYLSATPLKEALVQVAATLQMVALQFCENLVDNALLGSLGRNLPNVVCLDLRGNSSLNSLTGWYDGRASAGLKPQGLVVLARYSGVSKSSLEETKRIHPVETADLICILDGTGVGVGIRSYET